MRATNKRAGQLASSAGRRWARRPVTRRPRCQFRRKWTRPDRRPHDQPVRRLPRIPSLVVSGSVRSCRRTSGPKDHERTPSHRHPRGFRILPSSPNMDTLTTVDLKNDENKDVLVRYLYNIVRAAGHDFQSHRL